MCAVTKASLQITEKFKPATFSFEWKDNKLTSFTSKEVAGVVFCAEDHFDNCARVRSQRYCKYRQFVLDCFFLASFGNVFNFWDELEEKQNDDK